MSSRSSAYALAAASGVLLALSFPKFGHPALAWIALAPLLVALGGRHAAPRLRARPRSPASIYFTGTLYWITARDGDVRRHGAWVAVLINAALIAYPRCFRRSSRWSCAGSWSRTDRAALMAAPMVWVATELGRTHIFTGFPWVLLGYSQTSVLPIAQFASLFGVYGVSMLVASVSAAAGAVVRPTRSRSAELAALSRACGLAARRWSSRS